MIVPPPTTPGGPVSSAPAGELKSYIVLITLIATLGDLLFR